MTTPTRTTVPLSDQIGHILAHFDFVRTAQVMQKLNWTWGSTAPKTPSVDQLRGQGLDLLNRVREPHESWSTGGLHASMDAYGQMALAFVVTDWDAAEMCREHELANQS